MTAVGGPSAVLAHVHLAGPPRVGRYGVDLTAFERVALPALGMPGAEGVMVIDELDCGAARFASLGRVCDGIVPVSFYGIDAQVSPGGGVP